MMAGKRAASFPLTGVVRISNISMGRIRILHKKNSPPVYRTVGKKAASCPVTGMVRRNVRYQVLIIGSHQKKSPVNLLTGNGAASWPVDWKSGDARGRSNLIWMQVIICWRLGRFNKLEENGRRKLCSFEIFEVLQSAKSNRNIGDYELLHWAGRCSLASHHGDWVFLLTIPNVSNIRFDGNVAPPAQPAGRRDQCSGGPRTEAGSPLWGPPLHSPPLQGGSGILASQLLWNSSPHTEASLLDTDNQN